MGVDIILRSSIPKQGWLASFGKRVALLDKIVDEAGLFADQRGLGPLFRVAEHDQSSVELIFHPAEQAAHFSLGPDDIAVAARTSNAGPGYHVFMVDLLRHLERACALNWREDQEAGEIDETDYFNSGDFQDVIEQMDAWLKLNLSHILKYDDDSLAMGLPVLLASASFQPGNVLTARGPTNLQVLKRSSSEDDETFRSFADEWYVWPSPGTDIAFWERTASVLLWCEVPWRPPVDDDDQWSYNAARHALAQFRSAGGNAETFHGDETEIERLTSCLETNELPLPDPDGKGYFRRRLSRPLQYNWSIHIPGYWYFEQTDDDAAYWYSNMTIRSSLKVIQSGAGRSATEFLTEIVAEEATERPNQIRVEKVDEDEIVGFIQDGEKASDANFAMLGRYANQDSVLIVSCYFDDEAESSTAWEYLRSVRYAGPPPQTIFVDEGGVVDRELN